MTEYDARTVDCERENECLKARLEQCEAAMKEVCSSVTDGNFWNVVDDVPLRNAIYALYEILEWPKPERREP